MCIQNAAPTASKVNEGRLQQSPTRLMQSLDEQVHAVNASAMASVFNAQVSLISFHAGFNIQSLQRSNNNNTASMLLQQHPEPSVAGRIISTPRSPNSNTALYLQQALFLQVHHAGCRQSSYISTQSPVYINELFVTLQCIVTQQRICKPAIQNSTHSFIY